MAKPKEIRFADALPKHAVVRSCDACLRISLRVRTSLRC
ncbi:MAG: hypothetical protein R2865_02800 [Deinococcales bacterium]